MTLLSGLWNSFSGNKTSRSSIPLKGKSFSAQSTAARSKVDRAEPKAAAKAVAQKIIQPIASSCINSLEKKKLVATRTQLESESGAQKLTLEHLRSRIDVESRQYGELRDRQQKSMSHWFGERASVIDENALQERLSTQTGSHSAYSSREILAQISSGTVATYCDIPAIEQATHISRDGHIDVLNDYGGTLNFSDIHLPSYYDNQLIEAGDFDLELNFDMSAEDLQCLESLENIAGLDSSDELQVLPPLVAMPDDIPELEELLARLQIFETNMAADVATPDIAAGETIEVLESKELHLVEPLAPNTVNVPVEMVKHRNKGKKNRRRGGQNAAKDKNKSAALA